MRESHRLQDPRASRTAVPLSRSAFRSWSRGWPRPGDRLSFAVESESRPPRQAGSGHRLGYWPSRSGRSSHRTDAFHNQGQNLAHLDSGQGKRSPFLENRQCGGNQLSGGGEDDRAIGKTGNALDGLAGPLSPMSRASLRCFWPRVTTSTRQPR